MSTDFTEVYAVPGAQSIIDAINPSTGLTYVCGHTEAEVRAREPQAVRMPYETWRQAQAERQNTPIRWMRTTRSKYWEMLEVLPPAVMEGNGFLVGEPHDHCFTTGRPRFAAYVQLGPEYAKQYYTASRPLTVAEFRAQLHGDMLKK